MTKLKTSFYTLFLSTLLLGGIACDTCDKTMTLVDLLYTSVELIAGSQGFVVHVPIEIREVIKNYVRGQVAACTTTESPATDQNVVVDYQTSNGWQRVKSVTPNVKFLTANASTETAQSFTAATPGLYRFSWMIDPNYNVPEADDYNNGTNGDDRTRSKGNVSAKIIEITDPSGNLKPVDDVKDVKVEFSNFRTIK